MSRVTVIVVALAAGIVTVSPVADACGDKFMMLGRGPKFQKVYASVYPGKVLVYAKPSSDPRAAIRIRSCTKCFARRVTRSPWSKTGRSSSRR